MKGEESIYNLIPREERKTERAPKHKSHFTSTVKDEYKSGRHDKKTMGPAKYDVPDPKDFTRRRQGEPQLPDKQKFHYPDEARKRPPVPKQEERPVLGLKTTKDFIKENAVSAIMSVPAKPPKVFVDTKRGDQHNLIPSGLEPVYTKKKDYGEVPGYLVKREEEIRRAQAEYDAYVKERFRAGAMQQLSDEEREAIISGLKANWEEIHHMFQGLSVMVDTVPKKNRKERMEAEMKQLERDIELLEKHRTIYIA